MLGSTILNSFTLIPNISTNACTMLWNTQDRAFMVVEDNNPVRFLVVAVMVLFQPKHPSARTEGCNYTHYLHGCFISLSDWRRKKNIWVSSCYSECGKLTGDNWGSSWPPGRRTSLPVGS